MAERYYGIYKILNVKVQLFRVFEVIKIARNRLLIKIQDEVLTVQQDVLQVGAALGL